MTSHFSQLFAPARGVPSFSRWNNAETIKKNNAARASRAGLSGSAELQFAYLVLNYQQALRGTRGGGEESEAQLTQCINQ